MNRLAARSLVVVLAILAVAVSASGCGGKSKEKAASPLDNALGYVPANAPLVVSFQTDPNGKQFRAAKKIVEKFPFARQAEQQLQSRLQSQSVDYARDVKPLLGNQFVVAATNVKSIANSSSSDKDFVGAIQARDAKKLKDAIKKENAKQDGEKSGAKIYKGKDGSPFAIKDDVLVVAGTRALLDKALSNRESDKRFTEDDFDKATKGLPANSAFRLFTDLQALLRADPDTADARKIKWVAALRDFGLSASVAGDKIDVDFRLATDPSGLTEKDLPIAAGDASPAVIKRSGQIGLGLRDPGQVFAFGENAAQAVDPAKFGDYETGKKTIERQLKIDVQKDLLDQLNGDVAVGVPASGRNPSIKAEVKDPAAFKATLAKVTRALPAIMKGSSGRAPKVQRSGGLYTVANAKNKVAYGLVGKSFVLSDTASAARAIARAPTASVSGAKGAVTMQADAQKLVAQALVRFGGARLGSGGLGAALGSSLFTGPLGELTGSAKADTDGVTGKVSLSFD